MAVGPENHRFPEIEALRQSQPRQSQYVEAQDLAGGLTQIELLESGSIYPPPPEHYEIWKRISDEGKFVELDRHYPKDLLEPARNHIRERFGVSDCHIEFRYGGINQLLLDELRLLKPPPARTLVWALGPCFPMIDRHVKSFRNDPEIGSMRITYTEYPLYDSFDNGLRQMQKERNNSPFRNIAYFICNPSTPKGDVATPEAMEEFVYNAALSGDLTIIDEANADVLPDSESAIKLTEKYPNVLVNRGMKTFSESGGRIGWTAMSRGQLSERFQEFFLDYPLGNFLQLYLNEAMDPAIVVPHNKSVSERNTDTNRALDIALAQQGLNSLPHDPRVGHRTVDGGVPGFSRSLPDLSVAAVSGDRFNVTHREMSSQYIRISTPDTKMKTNNLARRLKGAQVVALQRIDPHYRVRL